MTVQWGLMACLIITQATRICEGTGLDLRCQTLPAGTCYDLEAAWREKPSRLASQGFISLHNFTTKAYALTLDINGVSIGISALP